MYNESPILLIWDIDGTLIACRGSGKRAMTQAFYKKTGVANGFEEINMAGRVDRSILHEVCLKYKISAFDYEAFYQLYKHYLQEDMADRKEAIVLRGVEQILQMTHASKQFLNVIGTGNCEEGAWLKLNYLGLDQYFETGGFGTHEMERSKVIEMAIQNAGKHFGRDFDNRSAIYVVGDTPADIKSGKELGIKTIAIATGGYNSETLMTYKPDFILESLDSPTRFLNLFNVE